MTEKIILVLASGVALCMFIDACFWYRGRKNRLARKAIEAEYAAAETAYCKSVKDYRELCAHHSFGRKKAREHMAACNLRLLIAGNALRGSRKPDRRHIPGYTGQNFMEAAE